MGKLLESNGNACLLQNVASQTKKEGGAREGRHGGGSWVISAWFQRLFTSHLLLCPERPFYVSRVHPSW